MIRAAVAIAAVTAILGAAAVMADTFTAPDHQPVAVLGDSITAIGERQLIETAGSKFQLEVRATFGARGGEQLAAASELAAKKPEQVVINLGTNDVLKGVPPEETIASLEQMAAMFTSAKCIHFVTVNTRLQQADHRPRAEAIAMNERILDLAKRTGKGDVIRWDHLVDEATNPQQPLGLTDDGVHPTPLGQRELAYAMVDALERCGRPWHIW
ncbi:MAG: SGNH/GDSL hydrolase family protein [Microthrixaceae bacterium]|nr:SGNH/GDSL hydrolase family protein [Microthrixaceae bacterium]